MVTHTAPSQRPAPQAAARPALRSAARPAPRSAPRLAGRLALLAGAVAWIALLAPPALEAGASPGVTAGAAPALAVAAAGQELPACTTPFHGPLRRELANVVTVMRKDDKIPGVVASALVPGQGCWTEAAGLADTARGVPVTVGDEFPIGSITKTFTATVILRLVQEGKLSLGAPISNWAPNVQNSTRITVRMLLDMTSGIYDEPDARAGDLISADPARVWTAQEVVGLAVAHGPGAPLGRFYYSNTNYILLGYIAQEVTGKPISELVSTQVLEPLHLGHTVFMTAATPPPAGMVDGYDVGATVADVEGEDVAPASVSFVGAAGAMVSTVGDMEVWARALATGTLLSPSVQAERLDFSAHRATGPFEPLPATPAQAGLFASYGLGLFSLADSAGQAGLIGHNGGIPGYTSDVFYLPARQATIIVLANGANDQFESLFGESVSDAAAVSIADLALPGAVG